VETDLIVLGVCGIRDPLRPEAPAAIQACKWAGVMVRMVTGDNQNTAISITRQCGILISTGHVMQGKEFSETGKV
jgi:Ca2+-transporting ATPase